MYKPGHSIHFFSVGYSKKEEKSEASAVNRRAIDDLSVFIPF